MICNEIQVRIREIENHSHWGGKACEETVTEEVAACYEGQCDDNVDCVWGDWYHINFFSNMIQCCK